MADQSQRQQDQQQQLQQKGKEAVQSFKSFLKEKAPQIIAIITLFPIGAFLLLLAGLSLTGSIIGLALATPVFILFSPVIVPAALVLGLAVMGFLTSGAFGITGLSAVSWIVNYLRGLAGTMQQMKRRAQESAGIVGRKVIEAGHEVSDAARQGGRT